VRLVHLSIASIAGCLLGLVILIGLTLDSVQEVRAKQAEVAELLALQARMDDFSVASDSLLLFGADDGLLAAYRKEAAALQQRLRAMGGSGPGAPRAVHRVEEIATTVAREIERRADTGAGDGPLELGPRSRIVMNQVAGLGGEMDSALDTLLRERQRQIARDAAWIGGGLAGAALLFGALSVIAFVLIHRRVAAPARALADTLQAIRGGDLDARAAVRGDDELADLANTLNRMLDERRTMDAELHERNRRLQQYERLVEHSADRFCIVDSEYRYVVTNEAYAALYGLDRASLEGARLEDILDREFLERESLPPIDRCLDGEPQSFEAERSYDSIGTRHFLVRYYPLPEADGSIRQVAAVMTDVTEQRQLDKRLRGFNELIEGTEDLCGIADASYHYLWVNRAYGERYGIAPDQMEGRSLREFLGEAYFDEVVRPRLDRCLAGKPQAWEDFVDRYMGLITHVINHTAETRSYRVSAADREDLAAEVFLALLRDDFAVLRRFRRQSSRATYLTVVSRRVVVRRLVQQTGGAPPGGANGDAPSNGHGGPRRHDPPASVLPNGARPHQLAERPAEQRIADAEQVAHLLAQLEGPEADAVRMYHLEGRSYAEISSAIGVSVNTVGPLLSRARTKLRRTGADQPTG